MSSFESIREAASQDQNKVQHYHTHIPLPLQENAGMHYKDTFKYIYYFWLVDVHLFMTVWCSVWSSDLKCIWEVWHLYLLTLCKWCKLWGLHLHASFTAWLVTDVEQAHSQWILMILALVIWDGIIFKDSTLMISLYQQPHRSIPTV